MLNKQDDHIGQCTRESNINSLQCKLISLENLKRGDFSLGWTFSSCSMTYLNINMG